MKSLKETSQFIHIFVITAVILLTFAAPVMLSADVPAWVDDFDSIFPDFAPSSALDTAGTAAAVGTMLMPSLLIWNEDMETNDLVAAAAAGAAVYGTAYAAKEILKDVFKRPRPSDTSEDVNSGTGSTEEDYSFPSGHTTMAFAAASYLQGIYAWNIEYDSEDISADRKRSLTAAAAWSMAALVSTLRIVSGEHHVSDVIAGAVLGSAIGFSGSYLLHFFSDEH